MLLRLLLLLLPLPLPRLLAGCGCGSHLAAVRESIRVSSPTAVNVAVCGRSRLDL